MKITCPQCGAKIETQPRSIQLICPFCKTPLVLEKKPFLESYKIKPTCEKEPAKEMLLQFLAEKNRYDSMEKMQMLYLPFYRFLYDRKGIFTEEVISALKKPPFLLPGVPSGQILSLKNPVSNEFRKPERSLPTVIEMLKQRKISSVDELFLLYIPFWKILISSAETIWIDAVQGKILTTNLLRSQTKNNQLMTYLLIGLFILLILEGLAVPTLAMRILFQGATALAFFLLVKKNKR